MLLHLSPTEKDDIICTLQMENGKLNTKMNELREMVNKELVSISEAAQQSCDER